MLTSDGDEVVDGGGEVEGHVVRPLDDGDGVVLVLLVRR